MALLSPYFSPLNTSEITVSARSRLQIQGLMKRCFLALKISLIGGSSLDFNGSLLHPDFVNTIMPNIR